jgi:hypothetical protein
MTLIIIISIIMVVIIMNMTTVKIEDCSVLYVTL